MNIFYVATLARYVLVDATDQDAACDLGRFELRKLYGHDNFSIRRIRSATDEIEFMRWHELNVAGMNLPRVGDRIRLLSMRDDPAPIPMNEMGTVLGVTRLGSGSEQWFQIDVSWDSGRTLMLVSPPDTFEIVGG